MYKVEAIMEAMNYCVCWNYPATDLELSESEYNDLLTEKHEFWYAAGPLARSSTYVRIWGVDVKAEKYPRKSMMRTKYLQFINPLPWIYQLAEDMEKYG